MNHSEVEKMKEKEMRKKSEKDHCSLKYFSYISSVIISEMAKVNKKEISRGELEKILLNPNFIGDMESISSMMNPRVLYTVLNKIERYNGIKL